MSEEKFDNEIDKESNSVSEINNKKTKNNESSDKSNENKNGSSNEAEIKKKLIIRKPLDHSLLEALFFSAGRPISVNKIAIEFNWEPKEIRSLVKELAIKLNKIQSELRLMEVQRDRWVLHFPLNTYSRHFRNIIDTILIEFPKKKFFDNEVKIKKVLTAVAFHQPVSKAKLFKVLSSENKKETEFTIILLDELLNILVREGFVRSNLKGSIQYRTTRVFSEEFGFDPVRLKMKQQLVKRLEKTAK